MSIFSRKKRSKELMLVFDVRSSSVGAAFFEMDKLKGPKIVASTREPIEVKENIDFDSFLSLTSKTLEKIAGEVSKMGFGKPTKIFCVLSSPWHVSETRIIKLQKNTPFVFNLKLANELFKKEISLLEEEYVKKFSRTKEKMKIIEFRNIKTILNGYTTPEPFGKKIKKLEMVVFASICAEEVLQKIEDAIFRHFHTKDIKFSSFTMASFAVARGLWGGASDFLLLDIAGEMTDISLIKKDTLNSSVSYPIGHNLAIRKISKDSNCALKEAKSLFSLHRNDHLSPKLNYLDMSVDKFKDEWTKNFQDSLIKLSEGASVPHFIFMNTEKDLSDFFSKIIKVEKFGQYTLTESEFKISPLDSKALHGIASFKEGVERDSILTLESIYINRFIC